MFLGGRIPALYFGISMMDFVFLVLFILAYRGLGRAA
jgi:Na+-transporting methylmalonyl-CoA/oxaloacetate decarboxylase gamma subunit